MSALQLPKSSTYDRCYLGCGRVGKHAILIAGYPLLSERATYSSRALLCGPCRKEWRKAWDEASGAGALKQVEAAIEDLRGSKAERAHAIFTLRDLGCSSEDVARALLHVGHGLSVEQVLEGLVDGDRELGAVA